MLTFQPVNTTVLLNPPYSRLGIALLAPCKASGPSSAARAVKPIQSPRREVKSITPANKLAKHPSKKLAAPKPNTLTAQVKASIQALIDVKRPFSANDVYAKLAETNPKATKPTVLSTASKLMATQYHLLSEERPSAGIRPMRVYLPEGSQAVSV